MCSGALELQEQCLSIHFALLQNRASGTVQTPLDADAEIAGPRERITPQKWNSEPEHLNGALQLVPLTKDDVQDMELRPHHVTAMRKDISIIKEALAYISRRHPARSLRQCVPTVGYLKPATMLASV